MTREGNGKTTKLFVHNSLWETLLCVWDQKLNVTIYFWRAEAFRDGENLGDTNKDGGGGVETLQQGGVGLGGGG